MNIVNLTNPIQSQQLNLVPNSHQLLDHALKTLSTGIIASLVTLGLFWLMSLVIKQEGEPVITLDPPPIIDPVFNEREIVTHIPETLPPQPKIIEPPIIPSKELEPNESDDNLGIGGKFEVVTPNIETSPNTTLTMTEGNARPLVRISPQYPVQPARDGIEGWVQLSFSINELGGVEDIVVVDAQPKRVFNRAAIKALRKWKYRPKMVDGQPVKQVNMSVQLDFNLEGNDAQ